MLVKGMSVVDDGRELKGGNVEWVFKDGAVKGRCC